MDVFLERDIFPELVKWAERSNKGLFLRGPRQVGKTRTLLELGKSDIFPGYLYINLRDEEMKSCWDDSNGQLSWYEKFRSWYERFSDYDICGGAPFSGERKPLVILDEVQESPRVFNSIRDIVREQKVRLIATGSYLGIAEFENYFSQYKRGYFYPSGTLPIRVYCPSRCHIAAVIRICPLTAGMCPGYWRKISSLCRCLSSWRLCPM